MRLGVTSEYGRLRAVVMASPRYFRPSELINVTQAHYFGSDPPAARAMVREQDAFVEALESGGVRVLWAEALPDCPYQLNTRDVGFVFGDTYVCGRMKRSIRAAEPGAVESALAQFQGRRAHVEDGFLEGGDVIVDGAEIYVGLGERTDQAGATATARALGPAIQVHPVNLAAEVLHLDVVLTLLPRACALVFRPGLIDLPPSLEATRNLIEVTAEEAGLLATNVLCLDPQTIIADRRHRRVIRVIESRGLDVIPLEITETSKVGGSFRCTTLPLLREEP